MGLGGGVGFKSEWIFIRKRKAAKKFMVTGPVI